MHVPFVSVVFLTQELAPENLNNVSHGDSALSLSWQNWQAGRSLSGVLFSSLMRK
jgi:hypothetical protein